MNGTLGVKQAGAINSGTLGAVPQPAAWRSGSLGRYQQPGSFNSGSLGAMSVPQEGAFRSGSLGEYLASAMQGLGFTEPEARKDGVLGEYFSAGQNMNGLGCACTQMSGVGHYDPTRPRKLFRPKHAMKGFGALGDFSIDTDTVFFTVIGAAAVYLVAKKK